MNQHGHFAATTSFLYRTLDHALAQNAASDKQGLDDPFDLEQNAVGTMRPTEEVSCSSGWDSKMKAPFLTKSAFFIDLVAAVTTFSDPSKKITFAESVTLLPLARKSYLTQAALDS